MGTSLNVYPSYNSQLWKLHRFGESGHHGESSIQIFYPDCIMGDILVRGPARQRKYSDPGQCAH